MVVRISPCAWAQLETLPGHDHAQGVFIMNVPVAGADALPQVQSPELIVDGLIGYRLQGAPHGTVADLIRWANAQAAPILALDVPFRGGWHDWNCP